MHLKNKNYHLRDRTFVLDFSISSFYNKTRTYIRFFLFKGVLYEYSNLIKYKSKAKNFI